MTEKEIKDSLKRISEDYNNYCNDQDKQSLFYIDQMTDLLYNELIYEVYNKTVLYDIVYNTFKKNLGIILKNLDKYTTKTSKDSTEAINELLKVSTNNRFIELNNLNSLYNNFKNEITKNFNINTKIKTLISTNIDILKAEILNKLVINNKLKVNEIIKKYQEIFETELINNLTSKKDIILSSYKQFIDNVLNEVYDHQDEIKEKNLNMIINTSYALLKEQEYININKSIELTETLIKEICKDFEEELKNNNIKRLKNTKRNPLKDYLLGFNNTIGVKAKNIFEEMNMIVNLEPKEIDKKLKDFNELITHIFEIELIFDKQFLEYKKLFNCPIKYENKFKEIADIKNKELTEKIKTNLFNIFRENIKAYNNLVYKTMTLKSKINEFNTILDKNKIKDLLNK